jgi:hypothetical protein
MLGEPEQGQMGSKTDDYNPLIYLTVPNLATPDAVQKMTDVVMRAGMTRTRIVLEPLAAASFVLQSMIQDAYIASKVFEPPGSCPVTLHRPWLPC